jgi:hypothetical protein
MDNVRHSVSVRPSGHPSLLRRKSDIETNDHPAAMIAATMMQSLCRATMRIRLNG